jgi:hypothetical protein
MKTIYRLILTLALLAAYVYTNAGTAEFQLKRSPSGLNYLKAEKINENVYLEWTSDPNHKYTYYVVERSTDAINFEEIAIVFESANTVNRLYKVKDTPGSQGVFYYRLKPVASGKNADYSNMVIVDYKLPLLDFSIYPNPSQGNFIINYGLDENESGEIIISDLTGNTLLNYPLEVFSNKLIIDDTKLERGTYFYSYRKNGSSVKSGKLMIAK